MRTTLKRGYGRAAGANGNGRAVFPPGARAPMTRYRQPDPPRRSAWRTAAAVLGWFVLCIVVLVVGLSGGVYLWVHNSVAATAPHSLDVKVAARQLHIAEPGKPAIALVLGYDHRPTDKGIPSRSDTIMLLRADPSNQTLSMLSFPRDLIVPIYCPGRLVYQDRINAAYADCGSKGTLDTIRHLTGVDVNYLITVNFDGFMQVVDQLGGVWIDVDRRYFNDNAGVAQGFTYTPIDLQPGYQKIGGLAALEYVRYRHTDSDLYRVARQQQFVKAAKLQLSNFSIFHLPSMVNAVVGSTEIAQAGGKGVGLGTMKSYALFLHHLPPGHFFQPKIENLQDVGPELAASQSSINAAIQDFLHPDVEASSEATNVALGRRSRKPRPIPPSSITITPLNGNGVTGAATQAATLLQQQGYRIVPPPNGRPANAPNWNYFHTMVYYNPKQGGLKRAADQVAKVFGDAVVARLPRSLLPLSNGAQQTVIVGKTFDGSLAPAPVVHTPTRQAPFITSNPGETLSVLRPLRRRVPFPLELPSVIERNSALDTGPGEVPVRLYRINGKNKAVRLVYWRGVPGDYWGIEETDWNDAPVLQGPNKDVVLAGRHYNLYYSGSKLHMVVLRQNGATYWVVNTLLDSLSNETMLAIARGLHPLSR
jgi:LCP family protein required for cell wall assembly